VGKIHWGSLAIGVAIGVVFYMYFAKKKATA
jgi:hypothetical protein